ncbi:hypothetical protein C5K22_17695, partial [Shigella dysenteriae]
MCTCRRRQPAGGIRR